MKSIATDQHVILRVNTISTDQHMNPSNSGKLIVRSHIDWRDKQVSVGTLSFKGQWTLGSVTAKTLGPEGRWIVRC